MYKVFQDDESKEELQIWHMIRKELLVSVVSYVQHIFSDAAASFSFALGLINNKHRMQNFVPAGPTVNPLLENVMGVLESADILPLSLPHARHHQSKQAFVLSRLTFRLLLHAPSRIGTSFVADDVRQRSFR